MSRAASDRSGGGESAAVEEYRALLKRITAEAQANETKWQRTLERQLELMRAETLSEYLSAVTAGLQRSFTLEAVRLVLEDPGHEIRHLLQGSGARLEDFPSVLFVDSLIGVAPQFSSLRRPWLGAFQRPDHRLVFGAIEGLCSIAFLPLRRHERATGVLCFGSHDPERFHRGHGSHFLQHLCVVAALCLENACNRERVLKGGLSDYLTGWHNRRYLTGRMREEFARARRAGSMVACLMIDVDHFKTINDTHGHAGGDAVLREVAARIEALIRASDTAARFGGDEFLLLLPDTPLEGVMRLAERIRAAVREPIRLPDDGRCDVTLSIGVAVVPVPKDARDLPALSDQLMHAADAALYRAKDEGRDCVRST
jgi:two-component system, cell cycle response regulator